VYLALKWACVAHSLNNAQWGSINRILKSPAVGGDAQTRMIQIRTRNIIYHEYDAWAVKQAYLYKHRYSWICRDVFADDLVHYARVGLFRATQKYDPNKCGIFTKYADVYVRGEMYRGVREMRPKWGSAGEAAESIEDDAPERFSELCDQIREARHRRNMTDFEYACMTNKYRIVGGGVKRPRSNAEVAKRMGCSEEWVRQAVQRVIQG
jgi:RNA polymerase sigma factor (sigma-70 family)